MFYYLLLSNIPIEDNTRSMILFLLITYVKKRVWKIEFSYS